MEQVVLTNCASATYIWSARSASMRSRNSASGLGTPSTGLFDGRYESAYEEKVRSLLGFGRAYRMLEALVQADITEITRKVIVTTFGACPEFKLAEVLAGAEEPLTLSEIAARAGSTRRSISPLGSLRGSLQRMERTGMVINVGSLRKPRFRLNLATEESKLLLTLFSRDVQRVIEQVSR